MIAPWSRDSLYVESSCPVVTYLRYNLKYLVVSQEPNNALGKSPDISSVELAHGRQRRSGVILQPGRQRLRAQM